MDKTSKILSLIGLATKAGKTKSGEFSTEKSIKEGKSTLVILAEDCSLKTKKKFTDSCRFYEVPIYFIGTKETLGHAMGKELRGSLSIEDYNFSKLIIEQFS